MSAIRARSSLLKTLHNYRAVRLPADPGQETPGGDCMRPIRLKTLIRNQAFAILTDCSADTGADNQILCR